MLLNISKNSYLNCIFQFSMGQARISRQDQKYFLNQSLNHLTKCFTEEDSRINYYNENSFFIKSFAKFNKNTQQDAGYYYPYSLLYKQIMIDNHEKIPEPILIHKTSQTASFIFPVVKIKTNTVDAKYKTTSKICLFGQQSTGSNIVQLNNNTLNGCGVIKSVMEYVTVTNLKRNEKFIYAYAGYDNDDTIINGIGQTSKEAEAYFPLPLFYISYYFCKFSYDLKLYQYCKDRAKFVFGYFTEKTNLKDLSIDLKSSCLFLYKLKYNYILPTCLLELEGVAKCFLYYAKCTLKLKQGDYQDEVGVNIVTKQKNILKNLNILMLGLEIACYIRQFSLIKIFAKEIYSLASKLFKGKNLHKDLAALFIRLTIGVNIIPNELWDEDLRNLSSLISYAVLILLVNNNEVDLYKKLIVQELGLQKKRFYYFKYKYMKKVEADKKGGKPQAQDPKTKLVVTEQKPDELVEADAILLKDLEKETCELDEYLLYFGDFNEVVKNRITTYIGFLDKYIAKFPSSPELLTELEKRKKDMNELIEVYENFKLEGIKYLQKFAQTSRDTHDRYYEICNKLLKKSIDNSLTSGSTTTTIIAKDSKAKEPVSTNILSDLIKISEDILLKDSDTLYVKDIFTQKLNFLTNDVIFVMKVRIKDFLNKVEKNMAKENEGNINLESIRIQIEEKYFGAQIDNEKEIPYNILSINEVCSLKEKYFWMGDILFNKAVLTFVEYISSYKSLSNFDYNNFMNNYKLVDVAKINFFTENLAELNHATQLNDKDLTNRHKRRLQVFEKLSLAILFMMESESYITLDNLMIFAYNVLIYEMMSPLDSIEGNFWCHLNIMAEIAIKRLEKLKKGEDEFTSTDYDKEIENIKLRLTDNIKSNLNFNIPKKFKKSEYTEKVFDEDKLLEIYESKLNLDVYIEIICFTIQATYVSKKWNVLSNLIQNFNLITNNNFCSFTLGYLIEAQKNIFEKANSNAKDKQSQITQRVAQFDAWKNSRKKNKRQQMITGEIPQEQLDFERDYSILSKESFILDSIAKLLCDDKDKSEKQYSNLVNDSNNSLKAVNSCRKLFEKYQIEVSILASVIQAKGENNFEAKSKIKAIKTFSSNLVNLYKKSIQILKKRQENYLLIQMLYEMSQVYYSENDIKNSEIYFNESLDTVFQKLYSLKDFRNLFETNSKNFVEKFGIKHLLYAVIVLHKLSKLCYDTDLYWQREAAQMSAEIILFILSSTFVNPSTSLNYATFRLSEVNKNVNIFKSSDNLNLADLLTSITELVEVLMHYGNFDACLPMLCLCEYLACDIVKNVNYLYKSRIMKVVCLAELGLISEAMQVYYKIIKKFDMPNFISNSLTVEKSTGKYASLIKEFKYLNNLAPDNQKNLDTLNLFTKLVIENDAKSSMGCTLHNELIYAKSLIYFKIYEKENYQIYPEKTDSRGEYMLRVEKEMREALATMATNEELNSLWILQNKVDLQALNVDVSIIPKKIDEILVNKRITKEELETYYLPKFNKKEVDLRRERLDLICKMRMLIHRVNYCQGLFLQSSSILLKTIENLKKFTSGSMVLNIETGEDYVFDLKPVDPNASASAKGGKPNPTDKKVADKKGAVTNNNNLPAVNDDDINKLYTIYNNNFTKGRNHPNSTLWFYLQYLHLRNLFKMSRFDDCLNMINKLAEYSTTLNDTFFFIKMKEIETMIHLSSYNLKLAEKSYQEITTKSKTNFIFEFEHAVFLANYAEFLFHQNKNEVAMGLIKEARKIIWTKMAKLSYLIPIQNYTQNNIISGLEIDKVLKATLKEREVNYLQNVSLRDPKKADPGKKGGETKSESNIQPINYYSTLDPNSKSDEHLEKVSKVINDSNEGDNLYFCYTDTLCRIDLRYVYFSLMTKCTVNTNLEGLQSVLDDLVIMSSKLLYPHTSFRIILYYLLAKIKKLNFIQDLHLYFKEKMLKISKNLNLEILNHKEVLNKFSNYYNERCSSKWAPLLFNSKELLEKSLSLLNGEFYIFELSFNISYILLELSDINLLISEYRPATNPKFADINQIITKMNCLLKTNKFYVNETEDLPYLPEDKMQLENITEKTEWLADKNKKEKTLCRNLIRNAVYYFELSTKLINIKKILNENISEMAVQNLIDPSKLPKDVSNQILENDYLNKKKSKQYLNSISQKAVPDAFDVYYYLKNSIKESEFFSVNNEELIKNISKLHKYLKLNSTNYNQKCIAEVLPCTEITDLNAEIVKKDQIFVYWVTNSNDIILPNNLTDNNSCNNLNLVYILGANSTATGEASNTFGRVFLNLSNLVGINRKLVNLKIDLKNSLQMSEQKKKRDLKYLQMEYIELLLDFAFEFLSVKKSYSDRQVMEDVIKKEALGEVTVENIDFWINFTNLNTFGSISQRFNAYLYELHMKLFS